MPKSQEAIFTSMDNSGFLFQWRVEDEVERTADRHKFAVVATEHRWRELQSGAEGYIDLILRNKHICVVIECKRSKSTKWIFLVDAASPVTNRARLFWTKRRTHADAKGRTGPWQQWSDLNLFPTSEESSICIMHGKEKPLLERDLSTLLLSLESLADEELRFQMHGEVEHTLYIPILVTNDDLVVCRLNPADVDLASGNLAPDKGVVTTVPYIRFRKSLASVIESHSQPTGLTEASHLKERTAFVVQASALPAFLRHLEVESAGMSTRLPWSLEG